MRRVLLAFALFSTPAVAQEMLVPVTARESLRVTIAGSGETVVLVPGLFGSAFGYRHLMAMLPAAGFRTIVVEPLGIGRSPRPRRADYSLTAQADRIDAMLAQLNEPAAMVVGHSLGASIALRLAYRHPERVKALILLDGGPAEQAATPGLRRAMRFAPWVKWLGGMKRLRPQIRKGLIEASGDTSWITDSIMDGYTAGARADLDGTLLAFISMTDSKEAERVAPHLAEIPCPVRLVIGTAPHEGGVDRKEIQLLSERVRDFRVIRVPGAGQYLFEEQPAAVVSVIRQARLMSSASFGSSQ
jgi:pimeloyl-ACP methyl ester carboxylesterase